LNMQSCFLWLERALCLLLWRIITFEWHEKESM
jgi:hypothetical protein